MDQKYEFKLSESLLSAYKGLKLFLDYTNARVVQVY